MDWKSGALIVSALVNIALLVLHFQEVANTVRSSLKLLYSWLRRIPTMIREWLWWKRYQPSWEILRGGAIKVTSKPRGEYDISVTIPIRYTSRDKSSWTRMTHTAYVSKLEIKHSGSNRGGNPYLLFGDADPGQVDLPPMKYKDAIYQFKKIVRAKPSLGKNAQCRLKRGANVYLEGIHPDRFLKSRKWFQLEVSDE